MSYLIPSEQAQIGDMVNYGNMVVWVMVSGTERYVIYDAHHQSEGNFARACQCCWTMTLLDHSLANQLHFELLTVKNLWYEKENLGVHDIQLIMAQLICFIQHCYEKGVVLIGLTTENISLIAGNQIKFCDFRHAGRVGELLRCNDTSSLKRYVAPECQYPGTYDGSAVMMWSYGVILWELSNKKRFPDGGVAAMDEEAGLVPTAAQDLSSKLLDRNPVTRLKTKEARSHPYFAGIDWNRLEKSCQREGEKRLRRKVIRSGRTRRGGRMMVLNPASKAAGKMAMKKLKRSLNSKKRKQ